MAEATTTQLLKQKELCAALKVGPWLIDDRIQRYPLGSESEFPVEYIGRNRRFDPEKVRAWFAAEARGEFDKRSTPAA